MNVKADPELRDRLLHGVDHPRVTEFLRRIGKEIDNARRVFWRRHRKTPNEVHLKEFVYGATELFMSTMEAQARQMYESDLKKAAREAQAQATREIEQTLAGNAVGEFAEAGVVVDEATRQDQVLEQKSKDLIV